MIRLEVKTIGNEELRQRFLKAGDSIRNRIRRVLLDAGGELRDEAVAASPVGSAAEHDRHPGKLRRSIKVKFADNNAKMSLRVGPPVYYGYFLEFGVVNHARGADRQYKIASRGQARRLGQWRIDPRPFFQPAADRIRTRIDAALTAAVNDAAAEA